MSRLLKFIKEKLVTVSMLTIMLLIVLATTFTWLNKRKIVETKLIKEQAELVKARLKDVFGEYLRGMDLGLRGYALTKNKQLLSPYKDAVLGNSINLLALDSLFKVQNLHDTTLVQFKKVKQGITVFIEATKAMKIAVERDSLNEFVRLVNQDKGYDLWVLFSPFYTNMLNYENVIIAKAQTEYEAALDWNIFILIILLALGVPSIGYTIYRTNKEAKDRHLLFLDLEKNNREYLFDPGKELQTITLQESIGHSVGNFKKATEFINGISSKNFEVQWQGFDDKNKFLNKNTLAGKMVEMRDRLLAMKQEEDKRLWATEGLTKFSELVRNHQNTIDDLTNQAVKFISKYVDAQQGSLFVVQEEGEDKYLKLAACFAYDRKKFIEKRIELGNGLLGQACLEKSTTLITRVPQKYLEITSGLGQSNPACLAIVPMKYNDTIEAIIELASFSQLEPYQVSFLERCGEVVASALQTTRASQVTKQLLKQSQHQAEEMKAQEEEMLQNMEEMATTQEESIRREQEAQNYLSNLQIVNESIANITFSPEGIIQRANPVFLHLMGYAENEIKGKHHKIFVADSYAASDEYSKFWNKLASGEAMKGTYSRITKKGETVWLRATYNPKKDSTGKVIEIIKLAQDITKEKQQLLEFERQMEALNTVYAVVEFDPYGKVFSANKNFLDLTSYDFEELIGNNEHFLTDRRTTEGYDFFWRRLRDGETITGELIKVNKDLVLYANFYGVRDSNNKIHKVIMLSQQMKLNIA